MAKKTGLNAEKEEVDEKKSHGEFILELPVFTQIMDVLDEIFKEDLFFLSSDSNGIRYSCNSKLERKYPNIKKEDLMKFTLFTGQLFHFLQGGILDDFLQEFEKVVQPKAKILYDALKKHKNTPLLLYRHYRCGNSPIPSISVLKKTLHGNLENQQIDINYFDITIPYEDNEGKVHFFRLEVDQIELDNIMAKLKESLK